MSARNPPTSQYLLERLNFYIYMNLNILLNIHQTLECTSKFLWLENSWDLSLIADRLLRLPQDRKEGNCWVGPFVLSGPGWFHAAGKTDWDKDGRKDKDISTSVI